MANRRQPAQTEREWWALLKSNDKTFIRSMKEWKTALADPRSNPLKGCTPSVIRHFTQNLRFRDGGLGHANFGGVAKELSYAQFANLWGRFGLGMRLFEDHQGYYCKNRGTCSTSLAEICTSNC